MKTTLLREKNESNTKIINYIKTHGAKKTENVSELQRLAEIGKNSGGFIHDLANHITAMTLSMDSVLESRKNIKYFIDAVRKHIRGKDIRCYFSPEKKLKELAILFKFRAERDQISLNVTTSTEAKGLRLYGSRLRFNQLFSNLVSNAIDSFHNLEGIVENNTEKNQNNLEISKRRQINIAIRVKSDTALISIADNGSGIDPKIIEKIFDPFFTTKKIGGIGLGLSTVKDIAEQDFGGSISLKSAVGKGSTFSVIIPFRCRSKNSESGRGKILK